MTEARSEPLGNPTGSHRPAQRARRLLEEARDVVAGHLGRDPGEIVLQAAFSWAPDDDAALEGARPWKGSQPSEFYTDDWHDPAAMYAEGARQTSDDDLREAMIVSSDPQHHVERIRDVIDLGATTVALTNNSGSDPLAAIRTYGEHVLPTLR